jgi:hypothetical protein
VRPRPPRDRRPKAVLASSEERPCARELLVTVVPDDVSSRPQEAPVHVYELRIRDLDAPSRRAAARWELFACAEVRDLIKVAGPDRFLVLYEGDWDHHAVWCRVLENAGYDAEPIGRLEEDEAS